MHVGVTRVTQVQVGHFTMGGATNVVNDLLFYSILEEQHIATGKIAAFDQTRGSYTFLPHNFFSWAPSMTYLYFFLEVGMYCLIL